MLDEANSSHPNIKLVRQIGTSVSFLDLFIENKNGKLKTLVFHKQAAEPYIVPFKSDHPRQIFKNVIDAALNRAVRYSSTLSVFHTERRSIKLMLFTMGICFIFSTTAPINFPILVISQDIYTIDLINSFYHTCQYQMFYQRSILKMTLLVYVTYY
jgi:hypothetical protein